MEIAEERIGTAVVLRPNGRLDGTSAPQFQTALLAEVEARPARLVLDLAGLEYVSSAGLRSILLAVKRGTALGCSLVVCRLPDHIREVFDLSGFGNVLPMHTTLEEALGS
jgi:anti-sigma B factor antagonist